MLILPRCVADLDGACGRPWRFVGLDPALLTPDEKLESRECRRRASPAAFGLFEALCDLPKLNPREGFACKRT